MADRPGAIASGTAHGTGSRTSRGVIAGGTGSKTSRGVTTRGTGSRTSSGVTTCGTGSKTSTSLGTGSRTSPARDNASALNAPFAKLGKSPSPRRSQGFPSLRGQSNRPGAIEANLPRRALGATAHGPSCTGPRTSPSTSVGVTGFETSSARGTGFGTSTAGGNNCSLASWREAMLRLTIGEAPRPRNHLLRAPARSPAATSETKSLREYWPRRR